MRIKHLLFYCITGIGIPCLLILMIEGILRLLDVGYDPHFFLQVKNNGKSYCVDNPSFGRRFFPPTLVRSSEKIQFQQSKDSDKCRIFILGSSAAQGEPAPAFSFSRCLDVQLKKRYTDTDCEIVNTGVTAINSHVVVPIARECSRLSPDVLIVYTGNNEVIGPFGPGTVFSTFSNLWFIRLRVFLSSTRIGQLSSALSTSFTKSKGIPTGWGGMKMFLEHKFLFGDPLLDRMYRHYRENLREICSVARRAGARVVLCTVASNAKDCPPFFSMHHPHCSEDAIKTWETLFSRAVLLQRQGKISEALPIFLQAISIDSTFAELQFRLAQCQIALGQYAEAREHFIAAREYDALRFRADARVNNIVKEVAEEFKECAVLFDTESKLEERSEHGICGEEQFLEHVHFNVHGNYQFAESLLPVLDSIINKPVQNAIKVSEFESRKQLAFTSWEEMQIDQEIYKRLTRPPFSDKENNQVRAQEVMGKIEQLNEFVKNSDPVIIKEYQNALSIDSLDTYVLEKFGNFLLRNERNAVQAEGVFRKIIKLMPQNEYALNSLAITFEQQGKYADAVECYKDAIKNNPLFFDAYVKIADVLIHQSRTDEAQRYLDMVLEINPELPSALQRYAQILIIKGKAVSDPECFKKNEIFRMALAAYYNAEGNKLQNAGQIAAAIKEFESAIAVYPQSAELHYNLGNLLLKHGNDTDAQTHLRIAAKLRADGL